MTSDTPSPALDPDESTKRQLGQFLTPATTASFMASLFSSGNWDRGRLLDPGAGAGSLTLAFINRWAAGGFSFPRLDITAFEIDLTLRGRLAATLEQSATTPGITCTILPDDFIEHAVNELQFHPQTHYTHAILNPPYRKIASGSIHRRLLSQAGIEVGNLYAGFLALALLLLEPGGELVAIIPRSFCNGPYFRLFRSLLLSIGAIRQIHLFGARDRAFKHDGVLQENIILRVDRSLPQGDVIVSTSTDDTFQDLARFALQFERIVHPGDPEQFIHIPITQADALDTLPKTVVSSLPDLSIEVSTGPVVDFRLKEHLRTRPGPGSVPLIYPGHFVGQTLRWPQLDFKKPNAMLLNPETRKWLMPAGFYPVVRRFSSKEEKKRIVANLVEPSALKANLIGFENHLNVYHRASQGLPEDLARGLVVYLNTSQVDRYFRRFSGHTQVNATDLRRLRYPSMQVLIELGRWARKHPSPSQAQIDEVFGELT